MARMVLDLSEPNPTILDPACGDGAFLAAFHRLGTASGSVVGVEIDAPTAQLAKRRHPDSRVVEGDWLAMDWLPVDGKERPDIIAGNPPYVRSENITEGQKASWRDTLRLHGSLPADFVSWSRRADLSAFFILAAVLRAKPGGVVGFVVSTALIDSDYGQKLWDYVEPWAHPIGMVVSDDERWFAEASVHTMIILLRVGPHNKKVFPILRASQRVLRQSRTWLETIDASVVTEVFWSEKKEWRPVMRGGGRQLETIRDFSAYTKPLEELATVRRGCTTGANRFFYLTRQGAHEKQIEEQCLFPLLRRRSSQHCLFVDVDDVTDRVFVPPQDLHEFPHSEGYIRENVDVGSAPTLRVRSPWWKLSVHTATQFIAKAYDQVYWQPMTTRPCVADQRMYTVHSRIDIPEEVFAAILNSTFTYFAIESYGRASMGEGALELSVADARNLPVLDGSLLVDKDCGPVVDAWKILSARSARPASFERDAKDRITLDDALCCALGLDTKIGYRVRKEWAKLCQSRRQGSH